MRPGRAPLADGLIVYYLHSKTRCPTCRAIESQAHDVVQSDFASELKSGAVAWKVMNYEEPSAAGLATKFEIQMPVVVLAKMKGGEIAQWKRLDRVWALVGDKPGYASYLRDEIQSDGPRGGTPADLGVLRRTKPRRKSPPATPADKPESPPADLPIPQ